MLMLPNGRVELMGERSDSAVVLVRDEPAVGFSASLATFSFYRDTDDETQAKQSFAHLQRLRAERGLVTERLDPPAELVTATAAVASGKVGPEEALRNAVATLNAPGPRLFTGAWYALSWNANQDLLPESLLAAGAREFAIAVTHRKRAQGRWGEHVVLVAYPLAQDNRY
jgi:hypothetical protein